MEKNRRIGKTTHFHQRRLVCIFALILTLAISLCACGDNATSINSNTDKMPIVAKIDQDGTAYLPLMDGNVITIKGDICVAMALEDRNTILVLEQDGLLYVTNAANPEDRTTIAENVTNLNMATNAGVIFENVDSELFRYLFADASTVSIGTEMGFTAADHSLSILCADDEGNIYLLPENATEPERIAHYDTSFIPKAVSNDGKTAVWVEKNSGAGTHTLYCYTDGNRTKLEEIEYKYDRSTAQFNKSQTVLGIADSSSQKVHFLALGDEKSDEVTTVKLGNELYSSILYTKNGTLSDETSKSVDGLYAMVATDSNFSVYYIANGDREKILSNVCNVEIVNGRIYYIDDDGSLNTAKLNGSELEEEHKVSSDVETFRVSSDGNYAYYFKNSDNNVGTLSRYNVQTDASEKISSNAYSYVGSYYSVAYFYISADGKTVYYFEDVEGIDNTYSDMGTLKYATVSKEPIKISSDIIVAAPYTGLDSNYVTPTSFAVAKYISVENVNDQNQMIVNWMYFDGSEAKVIAKDVYNSMYARSTTVTK